MPECTNCVPHLMHGLAQRELFPDLGWVSLGLYKVIIYCITIDLGWRIASYLRQLLPLNVSQ